MLRITAFIGSTVGETVNTIVFSKGRSASVFTSRNIPIPHPLEPTPVNISTVHSILRIIGRGIAITAVGIPIGTIAALYLTGGDSADLTELAMAVPRTTRVLWWSLWAAYGYKKLAAKYTTGSITEETYKERLRAMHHHASRQLLRVCQINGGVYVKAGQHASSIQAVPLEFRQGLEGLEDRVPPRSFETINRVLVAELGAPASQIFEKFDEKATAAASLAQVHRAKTKDGIEVAVKVQYPGLESAVAADLTAMTALASLAYYFFPSNDWRWLFEELKKKLAQELDFQIEAVHAMRLQRCFLHRKDITVPRQFTELSTKRVLCMEWIEGAKISDVQAIKKLGLSPRQVGLTLLDAAAEMMCVHGYVHGDMHPGNVFVRAQPRSKNLLLQHLPPWWHRPKPEIVLIDHGLYFELDNTLRQLYCMLWCAFVLNDNATATAAAIQLAGPRAGKALPEVLRPRDWSKVPPEERRRMRQEAGVRGMQDFTKLLNEAPRELVDCLRAMAMVRHTVSRLGTTAADRMRVSASQALSGLQVVETISSMNAQQRRHRVEYVGVMRLRVNRWRLYLHIMAMRLTVWISLLFRQNNIGE